MQNVTYRYIKGVSLAAAFFVSFFGFNDIIQAQPVIAKSDCFSVSAFPDTISYPPSNSHQCITVTICNDKCSGLLPQSFDIFAEDSCDFDICRTNGDFSGGFSPLGYIPHTFVATWRNLTGMGDNACATFSICRANTPCKIHILLSSHQGIMCVSHCKDAIISFK
jgi:hypothetical protein